MTKKLRKKSKHPLSKKKLQQREQTPKSVQKKSKAIFWKKAWFWVTVISISVNFFLAYLVLSPNVGIFYSSYVIPEKTSYLPLRVVNNGLLPIYNVNIFLNTTNLMDIAGNQIVSFKSINFLTEKIGSQDYVDYIDEQIGLYELVKGDWEVYVTYESYFFGFTHQTQTKVFSLFKVPNQPIRWITK